MKKFVEKVGSAHITYVKQQDSKMGDYWLGFCDCNFGSHGRLLFWGPRLSLCAVRNKIRETH